MNPTLTTLLEIQDLRSKLRELEQNPDLEVEEFHIDPGAAREHLATKIEELEQGLPDAVRRRYQRVASNLERVVVPVINGVCYGCFVSIAAATAGDQDPNTELRSCETCGRFLYILS